MKWFWPLLCFCVAALAAACDRNTPTNTAPAPAKVQVLAVVHPLADVARRVAGPHADVQWVVENPQRPEQVSPDTALRQRADRSQLVVASGPWDEWAAARLASDARAARIVELDKTAHAPADVNPKAYLWLDPLVVRDVAESLRVRLTIADPAHETAFKDGERGLRAELDALDQEAQTALAGVKGKKLLTVRPVWGAFAARYGLAEMTPVDAPEDRLTAGDFREITRAAKENGIKTIFVDAATPAPVRQQIGNKTGLRVVTVDPIGTSAPDGLSTYAKLMRYNVGQIRAGLE
jgi:ABC-type Zn uptake system ZnuABC Zn-binding protein ZnuA